MNRVPLKDISIRISSGITPLRSNPEYWSSQDIPWVRTEQLGTKQIWDSNEKISKEALEKTSLKLNPVNTLSVAMYGEGRTRGSVSIFKKEVTTNQACCNIVIDESKANYEYVYYFLKTQYKELRNLSSGVRKNLNSNDIKNFEIRLPNDLEGQLDIARVLSNIDSKIELNDKINTELEAMAKLIYDYWFVQFDFPDAKGKPYKSSGGNMVFNEELKRDIPDGWTDGNVDAECSVRNGYAFKSKSYRDSGCTIVRTKNFKNGSVELGDMAYIGLEEAKSFTRYELSKFDFLLVMVGASVGKNVVVNSNILPALQNQNMWCFRSKFSVQHFTNQLLKRIVIEQLSTSSGSAREFFKKESFREAKFANPNIELKKLYCEKVNSIFNRVDIIKNENQKLIELRDWLLPMFMNGQVTVK